MVLYSEMWLLLPFFLGSHIEGSYGYSLYFFKSAELPQCTDMVEHCAQFIQLAGIDCAIPEVHMEVIVYKICPLTCNSCERAKDYVAPDGSVHEDLLEGPPKKNHIDAGEPGPKDMNEIDENNEPNPPPPAPVWGYEEKHNGPARWENLPGYGDCGGVRQSPINIDLSSVISVAPQPFEFRNYDYPIRGAVLLNNGHSAELVMPGDTDITIRGGNLDGEYKLKQLHFHWGDDDTTGSEHTLGSLHFPLEMHLVHVNKENPNKLAVVGVFFAPQNFATGDPTPALIQMQQALPLIAPFKAQTTVDGFKIADFMPEVKNSFFRYDGSLTTPPCSEIVTWTLMAQSGTVDPLTLEMFRDLQRNQERDIIKRNFRPVQNINGRKVYFYHSGRTFF